MLYYRSLIPYITKKYILHETQNFMNIFGKILTPCNIASYNELKMRYHLKRPLHLKESSEELGVTGHYLHYNYKLPQCFVQLKTY